MLTTIKCLFLNPDGQPFADSAVEIQLHKQGTVGTKEGVYLPNVIIADTDEEGRCTLQLAPLPEKYSVLVRDRSTKATVYYEFYVPEMDEGAVTTLQDLFPLDKPDGLVWDEEAVKAISAARSELREANIQLRETLVEVTAQVDEMDQVAADAIAAQEAAALSLERANTAITEAEGFTLLAQDMHTQAQASAQKAELSAEQAQASFVSAEMNAASARDAAEAAEAAKDVTEALSKANAESLVLANAAVTSAQASVAQIGNSVREAKSARDVAVAAKSAAEAVNLQTQSFSKVLSDSLRDVADMRDSVLAEIQPIQELSENVNEVAKAIAVSEANAKASELQAEEAAGLVAIQVAEARQLNSSAINSADVAVSAKNSVVGVLESVTAIKESADTAAQVIETALVSAERVAADAATAMDNLTELARQTLESRDQAVAANEDAQGAKSDVQAAKQAVEAGTANIAESLRGAYEATALARAAVEEARNIRANVLEDKAYIESSVEAAEILISSAESSQSALAQAVSTVAGYKDLAVAAATDAANRAAGVGAQVITAGQHRAAAKASEDAAKEYAKSTSEGVAKVLAIESALSRELATQEADHASNMVQMGEWAASTEAQLNQAIAEADRARTQADLAKTSADRVTNEADRAEDAATSATSLLATAQELVQASADTLEQTRTTAGEALAQTQDAANAALTQFYEIAEGAAASRDSALASKDAAAVSAQLAREAAGQAGVLLLIAEGSDLNALNAGHYHCPTASVASTLLNSPITRPFSLIASGSNGAVQVLTDSVDPVPRQYIRVKADDVWGDWRMVSLTGDAVVTRERCEIGSVELFGATPFIDFHFNNSTADYTSRIIESSAGTLNVTGNFLVTGNLGTYSDIRLKTNIQTIPDALGKVKQLNGVTYDRADYASDRQTGLIAQHVKSVLPEAVTQDADGILSVQYGQMIGLIVEAIKELAEKIEGR